MSLKKAVQRLRKAWCGLILDQGMGIDEMPTFGGHAEPGEEIHDLRIYPNERVQTSENKTGE